MTWVVLTWNPRPWEAGGEPLAIVASGGTAGSYATLVNRPDRLEENVGRFVRGIAKLVPQLAREHEGVLRIEDFLHAVPDRGTSIRFSAVRHSDGDFRKELARLRKETFAPKG